MSYDLSHGNCEVLSWILIQFLNICFHEVLMQHVTYVLKFHRKYNLRIVNIHIYVKNSQCG